MPFLAAPLLGQQTPRLQLVPQSVANAAQDAIDIYEACGQRLDPWQDLSLRVGLGLREGGFWAAFQVGLICQRQNGKGEPVAALCLASLFVWGNRVTIYSAHRGDTVAATFRKIRALIEGCPDLLRRLKGYNPLTGASPINDSDDVIELVGGARLEFRTRTRSGGRGLTGDLVILDEALEVNPDQLAALIPILLARPYAQLWYTSTVPRFGDNFLCAIRAQVVAGTAERVAWAEWGADRGAAPDDPVALAQANPALGIRITLERLRDLWTLLGDRYETECMGIWPELVAGAVLDPALWSRPAPDGMLDPRSCRADGADIALSMVMDPLREHGCVGMFAMRADGLEHMQLVDYRPGVDWMVERARELSEALDPALWVIDAKNGVAALVDDLAAVGITEPVDREKALHRGCLLVLDMGEAADAVGQFIDGFRAGRYRHVGQEQLDRAVRVVRPRPIGDAGQIAWGWRVSGEDIGPVLAVTQARFGHGMWLLRGSDEYDLADSVDASCPCVCGRYAYPADGGQWLHAVDDSPVCVGFVSPWGGGTG